MNVTHASEQTISFTVWERPQMRQALSSRDIATVYLLLQRIGVSQRRIAALTGQSQSEISEIMNGRQVMAYDVLARIADGLGIPRGYMGLAYDDSAMPALAPALPEDDADEDEKARRLLAHAAQVAIGASAADLDDWSLPVTRVDTPVPCRIGDTEVDQVESITKALRHLDYRYGGGICRDSIVAQLSWSQRLLGASCSQDVGLRLHRALADQHNLAGWTSFDVGLHVHARRHLARALEQAKHAGDASLAANALYRLGRVFLHIGRVEDALRFFQLGQICAQDASCELTVAMLCANEAWAYGLLGDRRLALKSMERARDEFMRADPLRAPAWVRFFGQADLKAAEGMTYSALSYHYPGQLEKAADCLSGSVRQRGDTYVRSKVFELIALATAQLLLRDVENGVDNGNEAVTLVTQIRSVRTVDRLKPLQAAVKELPRDPEVRELGRRIADVRAL
ncbi:XRE family transcriptional regulator [Sphaerisporangium krabiense]|uniref:Transcriptional regulator with XRE-family HTH domain n=1 Tax=Sphaerisporangium krabiense TaxID=763782 RepID=A0A7W8Z966_9ACTN|nr:helix-turn-helix transcriptional regulator [Sphaerisporangium krabiense]MBB5629655.1 transcriptional regulator with XRE-family HTH domain [Sphaerisporangium krabiense]GII63753.1 XRE family transcriptional regulator [Sphaerisporangium krabiense]